MKRHCLIKLVISVGLGLVLVLLGITPLLGIEAAYAQVPPSGIFTATRNCAAPRAINGLNPGGVRVSNGQRYQAVGFNSEEKKFIQIKVPGATPESRWISTSCGTFESRDISSEPTSPSRPPISPDTALLPFFDDVNNLEQHGFPRQQKADITPSAPILNEFDKAVLATCGAFDSQVKRDSFKQLMLAHPNVLQRVKQSVGGELRPVRGTDTEFLDDLTSAWFDKEGFKHIFCGEEKTSDKLNDDIDGLHFVGRYLQLQEQGIGGRLPNNLGKEEVIPGSVYTLGVRIKQGDRILTDDRKGYPLVSDAEELLVDATKAFKAQGNIQGDCIYTVQDDDTGKSFKAVFVKGRREIVTFYPDATPTNNACRN